MVAVMRSEHDVNYAPDARYIHALYLLNLEKAGVHFQINDLTEKEWMWLAELKNAIDLKQIKMMKGR